MYKYDDDDDDDDDDSSRCSLYMHFLLLFFSLEYILCISWNMLLCFQCLPNHNIQSWFMEECLVICIDHFCNVFFWSTHVNWYITLKTMHLLNIILRIDTPQFICPVVLTTHICIVYFTIGYNKVSYLNCWQWLHWFTQLWNCNYWH